MFTIEIKINGNLISIIKGINKGELYDKHPGFYIYHYTYFDLEKETIKTGSVIHNRNSGINALIKIIIEDMDNNN